jgi:hypothetical protein
MSLKTEAKVYKKEPDPVFAGRLKTALFEHFGLSADDVNEETGSATECLIGVVCLTAAEMGPDSFKKHMVKSLEIEAPGDRKVSEAVIEREKLLRGIWAAALIETAAIEVADRKASPAVPESA